MRFHTQLLAQPLMAACKRRRRPLFMFTTCDISHRYRFIHEGLSFLSHYLVRRALMVGTHIYIVLHMFVCNYVCELLWVMINDILFADNDETSAVLFAAWYNSTSLTQLLLQHICQRGRRRGILAAAKMNSLILFPTVCSHLRQYIFGYESWKVSYACRSITEILEMILPAQVIGKKSSRAKTFLSEEKEVHHPPSKGSDFISIFQ